jgi:hypothetical protein
MHCSRRIKAPGRVDQAARYNERAPILNASAPVLLQLKCLGMKRIERSSKKELFKRF